MKVALLTIWRDGNFGAELQAYATIKMLKQLGHEVEMIDIRLSDKDVLSIKGKIGKLMAGLGPSHSKFNKFWKTYIPTTRRYKSLSELQEDPPLADVYLVGSDQVWNPDITKEFASLYFLNFGDDRVKRVSYASSFGTETWNHDEIKDEIRSLLNRFSSISCREQSGVNLLKRVFSIDSTCVLDPTLLFDGYKELTGIIKEEQTLAYYPLSGFPELEKYAIDLGNRLNLCVKNANWNKLIGNNIIWDRNSIQGWLRTIGEAQFVVTPSFHGVAMSLLHKKNFAVVVTNIERSTRLSNLLESLGLDDRIYTSLEALDNDKPWEHQIDYSAIDDKLNNLRDRSIEYLKHSLS